MDIKECKRGQLVKIHPAHFHYIQFKKFNITLKHVGEIIWIDSSPVEPTIQVNWLPGDIKIVCYPWRVYLVSKTV